MKYRYYINGTEVFPQGDWSITYKRNEGQIFFRRIFDGELTFGDADYDLITSLDCEIARFDIYCYDVIFWEGQFQYPYSVKFDADSCVVVLTPEVVDEYSCIMDKYDTDRDSFISPSIGGISPQLWTCPAPGANVYSMGFTCYPLINNVAGGSWIRAALPRTDAGTYCVIYIKSSFMLRDDFPNGTTWASTGLGTNNYITGATNRLEYIYIAENTDLRVDLGGTGCGTDSINFKDWEDLLRNAFNAYWFIDENGDFRVEHIHYFDPDFPYSDFTVSNDLTRLLDRNGRSFAYRRNKYEYEDGNMYDQERWTWQHYIGTEGTVTHGTDFRGVPVYYGAIPTGKSDYVPGSFREKEIASPRFWSDIVWAQQLAGTGTQDTIGCPGYCMLDVDISTAPTYKINCETSAMDGITSLANGHLSTGNLLENYHTYNRIFINGNMNSGNVTTFDTAQKHKLQEPIEFPLCCEDSFDPLDQIKTGLGDGQVKTAKQTKNSLEVELWHEFDCD